MSTDTFARPQGDPDGLDRAARTLGRLGAALSTTDLRAAERGVMTATADWTGPRKDDFTDAGAGMQIHVKTLGTALTGAGGALRAYASALRTAQHDIAGYARAVDDAERAAARAGDDTQRALSAETHANRVRSHNMTLADGARGDVTRARQQLLRKVHDISTVLVPGAEKLSDADVRQKVLAAFHQTGLPAAPSEPQAWTGLSKARSDSPDSVVRSDGAVNWSAWVGQQTNAEHANAKNVTIWDCLQNWDVAPKDGENPAIYYMKALGFIPKDDSAAQESAWGIGLVGLGNTTTRETLSRYIITEFRYRDPDTGRYAKPPEGFNPNSRYKKPPDISQGEKTNGLQAKAGRADLRRSMFKWTGRIGRIAGPGGAIIVGGLDAYDTWKKDGESGKDFGPAERFARALGSGVGSGAGSYYVGSFAARPGLALVAVSPPAGIVASVGGGVFGSWVGSSIGKPIGRESLGFIGGKVDDAWEWISD